MAIFKPRGYLKRYVIDNSLFSHVVGYTGAISSQEREDDEEYRYAINSRLGKSGIEKTFENELRGKVGYRTVEVDVHGKEAVSYTHLRAHETDS